jgi:FAD/FMN-containing dehydrogenase
MKEEFKPYETDASRLVGKALDVFIPKNISELKGIVANNSRIVIRGAGSGLSGGCVPLNGEDVVLDLSKLNYIGQLDLEKRTIEVEAGVVLSDLQDYLSKFNLMFPIDISSRDIATIGGMVALNSSSSRSSVVYGRVSNWIHWIEIVEWNGNISRKGATEISDFCGMEGISGVIVNICLKLIPLKKSKSASVLEVGSLDEAISIARNMRRDPLVSMVEFFDSMTSEWLDFGEGYHIVIEYEDDTGLFKGKEYERIIGLMDKVYTKAIYLDYLRVEDPKIIIDRFDRVASFLDERNIPFFSHMSNGIVNCFFKREQEKEISELMNIVRRMGGQISGSKGVGFIKKSFVDSGDLKIFNNIKKRTDPANKFNFGKLI